jgi:putative SOS response-associated peptidase YedK
MLNSSSYEADEADEADEVDGLDVFPDHDAELICIDDNKKFFRENGRWGFPAINKKEKPITNIRNVGAWWWREKNKQFLFEKKYRCLIPFSEFAEPPRRPVWFKTKSNQMSFFAGIWCSWEGERLEKGDKKSKRIRKHSTWKLFAFLTTVPNEVVKPYHSNSMPVIIRGEKEALSWLQGGRGSLKDVQKPIHASKLIVM